MLVSNDVRSICSFDSIVDLDSYIEKKDLCCLLYLGNSAEYILLLNLLKEHIHNLEDNDIVVFVDAYDVLILDNEVKRFITLI